MSHDRWLIRQIYSQDIDTFRQIRLEALQSEPNSFASTYDEWRNFSDAEWQTKMRIPIFVAFAAGKPVGLMGLKRSTPSRMRHRATLVMVYVRKSFRGSGLAAGLLQAVEVYASIEQISQIELVVREDNEAARRFYHNKGFDEVGSIPNGFKDGEKSFREVVMTRILQQPR